MADRTTRALFVAFLAVAGFMAFLCALFIVSAFEAFGRGEPVPGVFFVVLAFLSFVSLAIGCIRVFKPRGEV